MAGKLVELMAKRFKSLEPVEIKIFNMLEEHGLIVAPDREDDSSAVDDQIKLSGMKLSWVLSNSETASLIPCKVTIYNVRFNDELRISRNTRQNDLAFKYTTFDGGVVFRDSDVCRLQFESCSLNGFSCYNLTTADYVMFTNTTISNMFMMSRSRIGSSISMKEVALQCVANLKFAFFDIDISKDLEVIDSSSKTELLVHFSQINRRLVLSEKNCIPGINLSCSHAKYLSDQSEYSWPSKNNVKLDGFTYEWIEDENLAKSDFRLNWLYRDSIHLTLRPWRGDGYAASSITSASASPVTMPSRNAW